MSFCVDLIDYSILIIEAKTFQSGEMANSFPNFSGFVYFFLGLYKITSNGANVRLAQYIFAAFYIITLVLVFRIFHKSRKVCYVL